MMNNRCFLGNLQHKEFPMVYEQKGASVLLSQSANGLA